MLYGKGVVKSALEKLIKQHKSFSTNQACHLINKAGFEIKTLATRRSLDKLVDDGVITFKKIDYTVFYCLPNMSEFNIIENNILFNPLYGAPKPFPTRKKKPVKEAGKSKTATFNPATMKLTVL